MWKLIRSSYLPLLALFLVACGGDGGEGQSSGAAPAEEAQEEIVSSPSPLLSIPLFDFRSGSVFRLSDFAGKTVFIEPMATW